MLTKNITCKKLPFKGIYQEKAIKAKKPIINFLRLLSVCNAEANYVNKNKYFNASLEEGLKELL